MDDYGRPDRLLSIAFKLSLMAFFPFIGIFAGIAAIAITGYLLTEPDFSRSQRRTMIRVMALAAALAAFWTWLLIRPHLH